MATRALVVGGTGGIGYAIASRIASEANSSVVISGRNKPQNIPANVEFRQLDASSMRAIKRYTDQLKAANEPHLDYLVLTQGILTMAGRTETPEGIDNKMALHYYGRQLLIRELKPLLKDDAKVILVLDSLRGSPDKLNWEDLDLKKSFSLGNAMAHCLSMNDAMVQWHAAQQKATGEKRHYVHAFPGTVKTGLAQNMPWYVRPAVSVLGSILGMEPEKCAENLVTGARTNAAAGEKEGRFWGYIDEKGNEVSKKAVWSDEHMNKVAEHTWKITDDAINKTT